MRFHEATGGAALEVTTEEETIMSAANDDPVERFSERATMSVEAGEHLAHAREACAKAEHLVERGFYLAGALEATNAQEEAARAKRLLMRSFVDEAEDSAPEPTKEEKAEIEAEMARVMAADDLLEACEAAKRYLNRIQSEASAEVVDQLEAAIEKARPG